MTIYDVAKKAGVSVATVSRVINNNDNVKKKTRDNVKKVIEELGYKPNAQARRLSTNSSSMVGVMIPDMENPFFQNILLSITDTAYKLNYNIVLYNTRENVEIQHILLQRVMEERLSGLIVIPIKEDDKETQKNLKWINDSGVPVILIDRDITGEKFDRIFSNDFKGVYQSIDAFVKEGHKRIATISGPLTSKPGRERYDGFIRAMKNNGLEINKNYIKFGDFMTERAYILTKELLLLDEPPTAIFCANNLTSLGCLKYLFENNIKIGEDISIISFDEIEVLQYTGIKLSVVDRPVKQMGEEAINLLKNKIELKRNGDFKKSNTKKIVVDTNLILRGSEKHKNFL